MNESFRKTILDVARQVAPELGEGWSAADGNMADGDDAWLQHTDERKIHLRTWEGRLIASARVDKDHLPYDRYDQAHIEITMALTKTSAAIALDIRRRLVKHYDPVFYLAQARQRESRLLGDHRGRFLREIVEAMGVDVDAVRRADPHRHMSQGAVETGKYGDGVHAAVEVPWPTADGVFDLAVQFQIEVPAPLALKVAELIAELREAGK